MQQECGYTSWVPGLRSDTSGGWEGGEGFFGGWGVGGGGRMKFGGVGVEGGMGGGI